jgi:hypothetical protein
MPKVLGAMALAFVLTSPLQSQTVRQIELPPAPQTYGTSAWNHLVIPANSFTPVDPATGYTIAGFVDLHRTGGGSPYFVAPLNLPSGALVESVTAFVTDNNATANIGVSLAASVRKVSTGHNATWAYYAETYTADSPGQAIITRTVNVTVQPITQLVLGEPEESSWVAWVTIQGTDNTVSFNGVRVKWRLQVKPAPLTATFNDVPTSHPFFRFVEALAASGVTAGCSGAPPLFCPDAPITRGEMAVFLSAALGLHWAP